MEFDRIFYFERDLDFFKFYFFVIVGKFYKFVLCLHTLYIYVWYFIKEVKTHISKSLNQETIGKPIQTNFISNKYYAHLDCFSRRHTLLRQTIQETNGWMPILKISNTTDPAIATREYKQFVSEFKAMLDKAIKRVDKFNKTFLRHMLSCGENVAVSCRIKLQEGAILIQKSSTIL